MILTPWQARRLVVTGLLGLVVAACGSGGSVALPTPAGSLRGAVLDQQTGQPIPSVTVVVSTTRCHCALEPPPFRKSVGDDEAVTGADGVFSLTGLAPGTYRVGVREFGRAAAVVVDVLADSLIGGTVSDRPSEEVTIRPGRPTDLVVHADRRSTIGGRVFERGGEPAGGVLVEVLRLVPGSPPVVAAFAHTSAAGEFRLRLPAGEYYVRANHGRPSSRVPAAGARRASFFPGVARLADAETIIVAPGQDVIAIDFAGAEPR